MRRKMSRCVVGSAACLVLGIAALMVAAAAKADVYTDATADNYGGPEVDISNVVVTNDATNITFQINLNTAANIGPSAAHFANYEIGIQIPGHEANGQTLINGSFGTGTGNGNPYGNAAGISTGENYWVGSFLDGTGFSGGADLYSFSTATGWTQVGARAPISEVYTGTPSTSFSFPLLGLGLNPGDTFKFDVWTSFGSPQGAYDALDNTTGTPNSGGLAPYSGGTYDSATAPGSTLAMYTVAAVPEPSSLVLATCGISLLGLDIRRRWGRA